MTDIHNAIRYLKAKAEPKENLLFVMREILAEAGVYAGATLALEYLTLIDSYKDACESGDFKLSGEINDIFTAVNSLILRLLNNGGVTPEEVKAVRLNNIHCMEKITDRTDLFLLCEHMINRLEHRFEGVRELPSDYSDDLLTGRIMAKVAFLPEEERNLFLAELIRELPFRTTKQRFYDALKERLSIYRESDRGALTAMIGMLRSAAALRLDDLDETANPLYFVRKSLAEADLKVLTAEQYFYLKDQLTAAGAELYCEADFVNLMERVLNQLLILALSIADGSEMNSYAMRIMRIAVSLSGLPGGAEDTEYFDLEEAFDLCCHLEGIPEEAEGRYQEYAGAFRELAYRYEDLLSEGSFPSLNKALNEISLLLSDSNYASLDEEMSEGILTEAEFNDLTDAFIAELSAHTEKVNKTCLRAAMARMNGILPPRFTTEEGMETYIYESLRSCTDTAEKLGCIDIIEQLLAEC